MPPSRGDDLIDRLCAGADDALANELLSEVFRGYPVENLGRLLRCESDTAVRSAAWILSELGDRAGPMMSDIITLLGHPMRYVRFFALDAVLTGAGREHGPAVASAVALIADPDDAVRWKALNFLAWAGHDRLLAATGHIRDERLRDRTEWLVLADDAAVSRQDLLAAIDDADWLTRAFAAAAAVRRAGQDRAPVEHAAASPHADIGTFAQEQLASGRLPRP